jgi:hypothetical protein
MSVTKVIPYKGSKSPLWENAEPSESGLQGVKIIRGAETPQPREHPSGLLNIKHHPNAPFRLICYYLYYQTYNIFVKIKTAMAA